MNVENVKRRIRTLRFEIGDMERTACEKPRATALRLHGRIAECFDEIRQLERQLRAVGEEADD